MQEWFKTLMHEETAFILYRLLLALVFGVIVAGTYCLTQKREVHEKLAFSSTLVLLTILISMMTIIIGDNVARAFGIAGAIAIIRFRTVVEDTRDTAFVIFSVVVGMAVGADKLLVAMIGTPTLVVVAWAMSLWKLGRFNGSSLFMLEIRMNSATTPEKLLHPLFEKYLKSFRWRAASTAKQGSALDVRYLVTLKSAESGLDFLAELSRIEGVQSVELKSESKNN